MAEIILVPPPVHIDLSYISARGSSYNSPFEYYNPANGGYSGPSSYATVYSSPPIPPNAVTVTLPPIRIKEDNSSFIRHINPMETYLSYYNIGNDVDNRKYRIKRYSKKHIDIKFWTRKEFNDFIHSNTHNDDVVLIQSSDFDENSKLGNSHFYMYVICDDANINEMDFNDELNRKINDTSDVYMYPMYKDNFDEVKKWLVNNKIKYKFYEGALYIKKLEDATLYKLRWVG